MGRRRHQGGVTFPLSSGRHRVAGHGNAAGGAFQAENSECRGPEARKQESTVAAAPAQRSGQGRDGLQAGGVALVRSAGSSG